MKPGTKPGDPAKLDKAAMARALDLASQRVGREKIASTLRAEGLADVSGRTIGRLMTAAVAAGRKLPQPRVGRRRKRPPSDLTTPHAIPSSSAPPDLGDLAERLERLDIPAELAVVRATWLPRMKAIADAALDGEDAGSARDFVRLYIETAERLIAATPPPPPDPEDDPANGAAQARVRQQIERVAKRHEATT